LKWQLSLFHESPNLENYVTLRAFAQRLNRWISLRPELLEKLESDQLWDLLIVIALEEGEVNRAIELLPHQRWARHDLQVAEAAEANHPLAAIDIYCREVDRLIEARGRDNYQEAAVILEQVKKLYHKQNSCSKWDHFLMELRQHNARLPALMDELNKAGL
jgi:uncharacterized Zn finger protein